MAIRQTTTPALVAGLALALTACGGASSGNVANAANAAVVSEVANASNAAAPAAEITIATDENGLRLSDGTVLAFDAAQKDVLDKLAFRGPAGETTNDECGQGPMLIASWPDGLSLYFMGGKFTGWGLDARADTIGTTKGVMIGSPRSDLAKLGKVNVEESTLGIEFTAGSDEAAISGLLKDGTPKAAVTDLWAGSTCIFR